jgi:hypothetical protein
MRFWAETFALSVVAGVVLALAWWAQAKLGIAESHIGYLVIGRQRVRDAVADLRDEISDIRRRDAA